MLSITITSSKDASLLRKVTTGGRMTIGRDPGCDVSLPDPEKHISRLHAVIEKGDSGYTLTVVSKTNPLTVNSKPYRNGNTVTLNEGDVIVLHSYTLEITQLTLNGASTAASPWPEISSAATERTHPDPFGLGDLLGKPALTHETAPDPLGLAPTSPPNRGGLVAGIGEKHPNIQDTAVNPQSLDPIAALDNRRPASPFKNGAASPRPAATSPFDDILSPSAIPKGVTVKNHNPLVDLGGHRPAESKSLQHVHDYNLPYTPPPLSDAPTEKTGTSHANFGQLQPELHDDPFADTLKTFIKKVPLAHGSELNRTPPSQPHAFNIATPAERRKQKERRKSQARNGGDQIGEPRNILELVNTFRGAAGLGTKSVSHDEAMKFMASAGIIARAAIEGIVTLLASRSMIRGELGAENRTMVASRDNNPLKFMPDAQDALLFLLDNQIINENAYLPPAQAIAGACEDLIHHELGTTAGIQAAIEGSVRRFDPKLVEVKMDQSGKKVILNRKSNLWDIYVANYEEIEKCMVDDISQIYERDFRRAYNEQIRKLKERRK